MLARLVLLFVLVPVAELMLLVWLGEHVGLLPTLGLVLFTGVLGAALARHQGLATWQRFRTALAEGRPPHRELVEGILVLIAGAFLLTPGLITDSAGFALLVPPLRRRATAWLAGALGRRFPLATGGPARRGGRRDGRRDGAADGAVDVDYRVVDDDETDPGTGAAPAGERRLSERAGPREPG